MQGWIYGDPSQRTWTQKIYKHSNKFQNPLHQNYKNVKILESLLWLSELQIHSVIVFAGNSTFKTEMPKNVTIKISYRDVLNTKFLPFLT